MSEAFVGEIRMFAGIFAPRGWIFCDGQLLPVFQNQALFSLLGTTYGGDGRITFALPDLRGRLPIHFGSGPGLTTRSIGQNFGSENHTLTAGQMASHNHALNVSTDPGTNNNPDGKFLGASPTVRVFRPGTPNAILNSQTITSVGGSQSHTNVMPFLCVNFIISLTGVLPSEN